MSPVPLSVIISPTSCPGSPAPSSSPPSCSYVLTLITDGMRSVRAFHFDKAAASVLTSSVSWGWGVGWGWVQYSLTTQPFSLPQMVTMEPGYLFLGSRLGNSLLLKYTEKLQEAPASTVREAADKVGAWGCLWAQWPIQGISRAAHCPPASQEEPLSKKKRVDSTVSWSGEDHGLCRGKRGAGAR